MTTTKTNLTPQEFTQYLEGQTSLKRRRLMLALQELGAQFRIVSEEHRILECTVNDQKVLFYAEKHYMNEQPGSSFAMDKELTKTVLTDVGLRVPKGFVVETADEALERIAAGELEYPIVVKPAEGAKGIGVTTMIENEQQVRDAFQVVKDLVNYDFGWEIDVKKVIVEKFHKGNDHRILVLGKEVLACTQRVPGFIIGDGAHTVRELMDAFNATRAEMTSFHLTDDEEARELLTAESLTMESIPTEGQKVMLRTKANISQGGRSTNMTNEMSERFRTMAVEAALAMNCVIAGLDVFVEDITSDDPEQDYVILEINGSPDYEIHEEPLVENGHTDTNGAIAKYIYDRIGSGTFKKFQS